jgi:hypothetical protein
MSCLELQTVFSHLMHTVNALLPSKSPLCSLCPLWSTPPVHPENPVILSPNLF